MSEIRQDQKENASKFMSEFWNELVKPYYNPERTDVYWDKTYMKLDDMSKKYCDGDERLFRILMGFWEGLEREVQRGQNT